MDGAADGGDQQRGKFRSGLTDALLQFARTSFELSRRDDHTGKTRLQTLLDIKEQTGIVAPELDNLPVVPEGVEHVWQWFIDLSRAREVGFEDVQVIAWRDMWAYFDLMGIAPERWEVRAIRALDDLYLTVRNSGTTAKAAGAQQLAEALGTVRE